MKKILSAGFIWKGDGDLLGGFAWIVGFFKTTGGFAGACQVRTYYFPFPFVRIFFLLELHAGSQEEAKVTPNTSCTKKIIFFLFFLVIEDMSMQSLFAKPLKML